MSFIACLPLIEADIPAVLALDQRCLGGLWTYSGYQRELDSDYSDIRVLVSAATPDLLQHRQRCQRKSNNLRDDPVLGDEAVLTDACPAADPTQCYTPPISLLGVGCLWAILEEAHITTLAIEPSYQGQKLGLLLLTQLLSCGIDRGLTRATLEVRASNQTALNLYQKFGFTEAGQRKRYYSDGENARILWRSGLQQDACLKQVDRYRQCAITHLSRRGKHMVLPEIT